DGVLSVATGVAGGAASGDRRSTALKILVTAALRSVNFFTGFKSSKGATPAKLFHVSTKRDAGHFAVSLASSCAFENACRSSAAAGSSARAVMLLSESIVNVDIFLLGRGLVAVHTSITPVRDKGKRNRLDS